MLITSRHTGTVRLGDNAPILLQVLTEGGEAAAKGGWEGKTTIRQGWCARCEWEMRKEMFRLVEDKTFDVFRLF